MLSLEGRCDIRDFHNLCDNINSLTGQNLTPKTAEGRRVGWDFNFNATKSVSIARELAGDKGIETAHREAVEHAMAELEKDMRTRIRTGIRQDRRDEDRVTGNLIGNARHAPHYQAEPARSPSR